MKIKIKTNYYTLSNLCEMYDASKEIENMYLKSLMFSKEYRAIKDVCSSLFKKLRKKLIDKENTKKLFTITMEYFEAYFLVRLIQGMSTYLATTYILKSKMTSNVWEFQYDLNGILKEFKIIDGELTEEQKNYLFHPKRFPYTEDIIKIWQKSVKKVEVIIGKPDLSFDTFWNLYNYKVSKKNAQTQWKKLSELDKLNAIKNIKAYDGFLKRNNTAKVYPERYLKNRRFDDQFNAY